MKNENITNEASEQEQAFEFYSAQFSREAEQLQRQMDQDFLYEFAWKGEALFKTRYKAALLNAPLRDYREGAALTFEIAFEQNKEELVKRVLKPYWRENSTGDLFRITSVWKHEVEIEILTKFYAFKPI